MPLEQEKDCRLWIGFYVNRLPKSCVAEWWFVHVVEVVDLGMSETEMRLVERMIHEHLVHRVGTIRENFKLKYRRHRYCRLSLHFLSLPQTNADYLWQCIKRMRILRGHLCPRIGVGHGRNLMW